MFTKRKISNRTFEACSVFDVDGDGIADIVSGEYWYKGPDFNQSYKFREIMPVGEWFDDFSNYPMDVNGNGKIDIVTGGWWGETLRWIENPGNNGEWKVHDIAPTGNIETIRYFDIDNCGTVEVFPNTPGMPQCFFKLDKDENGVPKGTFTKHVIGNVNSGHGMGFGDINGDGKIEIILTNGYLKQTGSVFDKWAKIDCEFGEFAGSIPMLVYDVNGDGLMDIIKGNSHGYGLYWYEQKADGRFVEHLVEDTRAQYHDMQLVDIDGDGELELLTGKRFRAHCGSDPGDDDNPGVYYFKIKNGEFTCFDIDYGPPETSAGTGIYYWLHDFNNNGLLDIVVAGKTGLFLFTQ